MDIDITKELKKTFDDAVMVHEAKSLKQGQDWKEANDIIERGKSEREQLEDKYQREYDTRVEIVRKRLINEGGQIDYKHPAPAGSDIFDPEAIERQAHREVQFDHQNVLQQSRDNQQSDMDALLKKATERELSSNKGRAVESFNKASDRRQNPERRAPDRSR